MNPLWIAGSDGGPFAAEGREGDGYICKLTQLEHETGAFYCYQKHETNVPHHFISDYLSIRGTVTLKEKRE